MAARGFNSIKTYNDIHVFSDSIINRILRHKDDADYISSDVVLNETPAILLRTRLYNERRKHFEQKQESENCLV